MTDGLCGGGGLSRFMNDDKTDDWQENEYITNYEDCLDRTVIFKNIRSMRKNFGRFKDIIDLIEKKPLVIALSEIWSPLPWQEHLNDYQRLEKRVQGEFSKQRRRCRPLREKEFRIYTT